MNLLSLLSLLGILLRRGGIYVLISNNPWIMGIGVIIFVISIANRFMSSENDDDNDYEKPKITKYTLCKACAKKKFDMKTGIYCGETGKKPDYAGICDRFEKALN